MACTLHRRLKLGYTFSTAHLTQSLTYYSFRWQKLHSPFVFEDTSMRRKIGNLAEFSLVLGEELKNQKSIPRGRVKLSRDWEASWHRLVDVVFNFTGNVYITLRLSRVGTVSHDLVFLKVYICLSDSHDFFYTYCRVVFDVWNYIYFFILHANSLL